MVVHDQFPIFRLATQLARQVSAPIAARIKEYARTHPRFARAVCERAGRQYRAAELRYKVWTFSLRQPSAIAVSDADALNMGADILGEAILFILGALIVIFEVNRQAIKQENKVLAEKSEWLAIKLTLEELKRELAMQQQDIDRFMGTLRRLADDAGRPPSASAPAPAPAPDRPPLFPPEAPPCPITSIPHPQKALPQPAGFELTQ